MAFYTSIMIQVLVGVGLLIVSPHLFGFGHMQSGMLRVWIASMHFFVFPLILLIAQIRHFGFSAWLNIAWEGWLLIGSAWVLFRIPSAYPTVNLYGILLVTLVLITASSALIDCVQKILGDQTPKKPATPPPLDTLPPPA